MAGGIFSPCLSVGATIGFSAARIFHFVDPKKCALFGMVAFFSGAVRAPLTAVIIVMEMTDEQALIFPFMVAAFIGQGLGRLFLPHPSLSISCPEKPFGLRNLFGLRKAQNNFSHRRTCLGRLPAQKLFPCACVRVHPRPRGVSATPLETRRVPFLRPGFAMVHHWNMRIPARNVAEDKSGPLSIARRYIADPVLGSVTNWLLAAIATTPVLGALGGTSHLGTT